jgi:hypothetical protein
MRAVTRGIKRGPVRHMVAVCISQHDSRSSHYPNPQTEVMLLQEAQTRNNEPDENSRSAVELVRPTTKPDPLLLFPLSPWPIPARDDLPLKASRSRKYFMTTPPALYGAWSVQLGMQ